jgi:plastocyanin
MGTTMDQAPEAAREGTGVDRAARGTFDRRGRHRWRLVAALLAVAVVTAGACGDDDDDSDAGSDAGSEDAGTDGATLEVTEFEYDDVTAPAGGTLEVVNSSGGAHTFTADDDEFDDEVPDGETVSVDVPAEPGEYPFHCEIHPSMQATLTAE